MGETIKKSDITYAGNGFNSLTCEEMKKNG